MKIKAFIMKKPIAILIGLLHFFAYLVFIFSLSDEALSQLIDSNKIYYHILALIFVVTGVVILLKKENKSDVVYKYSQYAYAATMIYLVAYINDMTFSPSHVLSNPITLFSITVAFSPLLVLVSGLIGYALVTGYRQAVKNQTKTSLN